VHRLNHAAVPTADPCCYCVIVTHTASRSYGPGRYAARPRKRKLIAIGSIGSAQAVRAYVDRPTDGPIISEKPWSKLASRFRGVGGSIRAGPGLVNQQGVQPWRSGLLVRMHVIVHARTARTRSPVPPP
jgi:hypothetical protein